MNRHEEILSVALIDACSLGRLDVVKILLQRGANINYINVIKFSIKFSSLNIIYNFCFNFFRMLELIAYFHLW